LQGKNHYSKIRKIIVVKRRISVYLCHKTNAMAEKKHRGRIQAQGGELEKSVKWAQNEPLTKSEGLALLYELKNKLSKKEFQDRADQFVEAECYIQNIKGGTDAVKKKTSRQGNPNIQVYIEILVGTAFIAIALFILFIAFAFK